MLQPDACVRLQDDVGGQRTLQRKWTSFAKAPLLCQSPKQIPFNILQDVFTLQPPEGGADTDTLFYGVFTPQWCVYETIHNVVQLPSGNKTRQQKNSFTQTPVFVWSGPGPRPQVCALLCVSLDYRTSEPCSAGAIGHSTCRVISGAL